MCDFPTHLFSHLTPTYWSVGCWSNPLNCFNEKTTYNLKGHVFQAFFYNHFFRQRYVEAEHRVNHKLACEQWDQNLESRQKYKKNNNNSNFLAGPLEVGKFRVHESLLNHSLFPNHSLHFSTLSGHFSSAFKRDWFQKRWLSSQLHSWIWKLLPKLRSEAVAFEPWQFNV